MINKPYNMHQGCTINKPQVQEAALFTMCSPVPVVYKYFYERKF